MATRNELRKNLAIGSPKRLSPDDELNNIIRNSDQNFSNIWLIVANLKERIEKLEKGNA